jgi:hypothetical protein
MKAVKANIDKEVALPFAGKPFHPTSSTKFILFLLPHIVFALECTQLSEIKSLLCICKVFSLCLEEIVSICGLGFFLFFTHSRSCKSAFAFSAARFANLRLSIFITRRTPLKSAIRVCRSWRARAFSGCSQQRRKRNAAAMCESLPAAEDWCLGSLHCILSQ